MLRTHQHTLGEGVKGKVCSRPYNVNSEIALEDFERNVSLCVFASVLWQWFGPLQGCRS